MNFLPFVGFAFLLLFAKVHLAKKEESAKQEEQLNKANERKNVLISP